MKPFRSFLPCVLSCTALVAQGAKPESKTPPVDPDAWSVHRYSFPSDELMQGFVSRERGQIHAPALPPANASAEEIQKFLRRSHDVVSQYLSAAGIPLVKGSLAAYDPASMVLAVRTLNSTQDLVAAYAAPLVSHAPQMISFNVHIVEMDGAVLRGMMKEACATTDQGALWERVEALVEQGKARETDTLRVDTRSGQHVQTTLGEQHRFPGGFTLGGNGWFEVPLTQRLVGTLMDLDPVVGPDGRTVNVVGTLDHDFAAPVERWELAAQNGAERIESKVTNFHQCHFKTALTLLSGMTTLFAVWKPEGAPEPERADALEAAFLTAKVVPVVPLPDDRVMQLLKEQGEKVEPTPPPGSRVPNDKLPSGMVLRSFRVTPDFLMSSPSRDGSPPPDPFGSPTATRDEPRAMRSVTAVDVLKIAGVPFPEGSSANLSAATGELIVRNTPDNMEKIEAYLAALMREAPSQVAFSVHVVQADAKLLRGIIAQTIGLPDHRAAWHQLEEAVAQGKAKILASTWVQSRSGQNVAATFGTSYMTVQPPQLNLHAPHAGAAGNNGNAPAAANAETAASDVGLSADHEATSVGFKFEADSVIGPDGGTLNIALAFDYHYAPPTFHFDSASGGEKVLRASTPTTDFHKITVTTAVTMDSGAIRLIGVWKPEGAAALQNGDVLQAAFLKADILPVEEAGAVEGRR